jgi:hypothetical protein
MKECLRLEYRTELSASSVVQDTAVENAKKVFNNFQRPINQKPPRQKMMWCR